MKKIKKTTSEENKPARKREISRSGDHDSNNNNREKHKNTTKN